MFHASRQINTCPTASWQHASTGRSIARSTMLQTGGQSGSVPPHGKAKQELQWLASSFSLTHVPEQQAGLTPVHRLAEEDPQ
ncbi:hypothetical protein N7491_000968 [Penicillium cf. griseofulvum]|uniref:Uncharacterized protein n=1 Tax=Penicillium cf. griseofulvum TaxID=2972120 RepID=A0A9W9JBD5_9EURO|nr:hypothetical protein N7472_006104 [Penicillium cf. griseofulvum]KAJ5444886.1 hypothetical protein N7491_000968 [Penicillium cf. griseofulvum]KAJ5446601.1 hypothetical protein N7445_001422 [Penicillium cf. griseofulvum]